MDLFKILQDFERVKTQVPPDIIIPIMRGNINKNLVYIGYQDHSIFYLDKSDLREVSATPENIAKAFAAQGLELQLDTATQLATQALKTYERIRYTIE